MSELVKEDFIKTELKKYNVSDAALAKLNKEYMAIEVRGFGDIEGYVMAKMAHQEMKKFRIDIDKKRKELKADSIAFGKAIEGEAKRLTTKVTVIEDHLLTQLTKKSERQRKRVKQLKLSVSQMNKKKSALIR